MSDCDDVVSSRLFVVLPFSCFVYLSFFPVYLNDVWMLVKHMICCVFLFCFVYYTFCFWKKKVSNICASFTLGIGANFIQSGAILTVELLQSAGVLLCSL